MSATSTILAPPRSGVNVASVLAEAIRGLLTRNDEASALIRQADESARSFHLHEANQKRLFDAIAGNVHSKD